MLGGDRGGGDGGRRNGRSVVSRRERRGARRHLRDGDAGHEGPVQLCTTLPCSAPVAPSEDAGSDAPDGADDASPSPCFGCTNTPLVLAFHDEPVEFTRTPGAFDLTGIAASVATDWVGSATPWLALDRNGNGAIDDGRELFGSMTELPDGQRAPNGFVALSALDDDGDGQITARDASFARLLVWRDVDQDRRSSPGEIESAAAAGLVAIRLDDTIDPRCIGGDCEVERARFVYRDATGREHEGAVVDVHLNEPAFTAPHVILSEAKNPKVSRAHR